MHAGTHSKQSAFRRSKWFCSPTPQCSKVFAFEYVHRSCVCIRVIVTHTDIHTCVHTYHMRQQERWWGCCACVCAGTWTLLSHLTQPHPTPPHSERWWKCSACVRTTAGKMMRLLCLCARRNMEVITPPHLWRSKWSTFWCSKWSHGALSDLVL